MLRVRKLGHILVLKFIALAVLTLSLLGWFGPSPAQAGVVDVQVSQGSDDMEEYVGTGALDAGSTDLELSAESGTANQYVGMRFLNVTIPQGATITNAYIEFTVDAATSGSLNLKIEGEAADNPPTFGTTLPAKIINPTARPRTTAYVDWNNVPNWPTVGAKQQTPDISPIIQEIVNRPGWVSGNAMVLIVTGPAAGVWREAESYESGATLAPLLHVEYTTCGAVSDAAYVAANAQSGQATVYWAASDPALILRKTAAFAAEAPGNGTSYNVNDTGGGLGTATVVYNGSVAETSFTQSGLTNGTTYSYKVFPKQGTCYAAGIEVNASPNAGTHPAWSYMMSGGSALRAGIAGEGAIYTAGNPSRIISLSTANGTQSWTPVATNAAVQGWLTWLPIGGQGVKSLQTGTVTMTTTPRTATLSPAVDPDRAFVVCPYLVNSSASNTRATCELTSGSQVTITAEAADSSEVVRWYVVEFGGGVTVQRGLETFGTTDSDRNVSLASVDLSKSFVLITERTDTVTGSDERWTIRAQLTSATNLELSRLETGHTTRVAWQVIQTGNASVQRGLTTIPSGASSATASIGSVDVTKSFLVMSRRGGTGVNGVETRYQVRGELTSSTLLTFTRVSSESVTGNLVDIAWEVVSFTDATSVQGGTTNIRSNALSVSQAISTIDTSRTVPFITVSGGKAGDTSTLDATTVRATLTSTTNLQLERADTGGAADVAWFVVQFPALSTATTVFGGDQGGKVYSVNTTTGATNTNWPVTLSGAEAVQAAVAAQLRQYSNASFRGTYSTDVLFAATRNSSTTNNKVFALKATDGTVLWTFNQNGTDYQVDYIVGMPYVDYTRNRLYVASRAGSAGTQQSLWVINSLTGARVDCANANADCTLGHLETSPTLSYDGTTLYVANTAGDLYALDASTLSYKWTGTHKVALGSAIKGFVWEDWTTPGRLYFSTADGNVWCLQDPGAGLPPNPASPVWKTAVAGPATPLFLGTAVFVGSSDGKVHQLNPTTGADEKQFTVGDGTKIVGDLSTEDLNQVFAPTSEGKIYKLPLPLP